MDKYKESFIEESRELVAEVERSLLQLETASDQSLLIQQVFRALHTIKGNSAMFGFTVIAEFAHHLESVYEYVRSGQKRITKDILDVTLAGIDHLGYLIQNTDDRNINQTNAHLNITNKLIGVVKDIESGANSQNIKSSFQNAPAESRRRLNIYNIFFAPFQDIFYNGTNPLTHLKDLKSLGNCTVTANLSDVPFLEDIDPTYCYTSWNITLETSATVEAIAEIFVFLEGKADLKIALAEEKDASAETHMITGIEGVTNERLLKSAGHEEINQKNVISSVRVPSEKLDNLMSLVSELITLQAKLGTLAEGNPHSEIISVSENLEKILTKLRDNAFGMCLVPIKTIITPFNRLVRDLANELHKDIEFITEGIETELDKNIMEGLSDPIMHILRNSIDHGIEDQQTRERLGKKKYGKIVFRAYCASTNVYVEIQDDGKGMDPEKIRSKAILKGLICKDELLSESEIFNLVFLPGFSMAEQVSKISGRGVGMDVVKRKIEEIRGQIKIKSEVNIGTTITIKLPITVSIIDGLLVKVNEGSFVIPLSAVDRCFETPSSSQLNRFNKVLVLDGEQIPFIDLSKEFDGEEQFGVSREIVLVYFEEKRVALLVDRVMGKFQAVLKPLGRYFQKMDSISGATILGDGAIALVLDTNKVVEQYLQRKRLAVC